MSGSLNCLCRTVLRLLNVVLLFVLPLKLVGQTDWTVHDTSTPEVVSGLAYSDSLGRYVAVGERGAILISEDGMVWTERPLGTTRALRSVVFAGGKFVAVGERGTIFASSDGVSWASRSSGVTQFIAGVTHGGGKFVAVGGSGVILTSADTISWTMQTSGTTRFLEKIHYAAGRFVAVGNGGVIRTSLDGISWGGANSTRTEILSAVHYFSGTWYVGGQAGVLLASADGLSWNLINRGDGSWIRGITDDGERLLSVGDYGSLHLSFDGEIWNALDSGLTSLFLSCSFHNDLFIVTGEPTTLDPEEPAFGLLMSAPQTSFIRWESSAFEVSEDSGVLALDIIRSEPLEGTEDVVISAANGSAVSGIDFTEPPGSATFTDESDKVTIEIPILNNPELELKETFFLSVSATSGGSLRTFPPQSIEVTIVDAQDSDEDSLPDLWEIEHFGSIELYVESDDPDGDSNSNGRELADGTHPLQASSALYNLNLSIGSGEGMTQAIPGKEQYFIGESVSMEATPEEGNVFAGWTGDVGGSVSPKSIVMDGDKSVIANFSSPTVVALDVPVHLKTVWTTSNPSGAVWVTNFEDTSDGFDALTISGGAPLQTASVSTRVLGPVQLGFYWKLEAAPGTRLSLVLDGVPQLVIKGTNGWVFTSLPVSNGPHTLRWDYTKTSAGISGTGMAGLDQVSIDNSYYTWANTFFVANAGDPLFVGKGADPDKDGWGNLTEYLMGSNPSVPHDTAGFDIDISDTNVPRIQYQFVCSRMTGFSLELEFSETLLPGDWESAGSLVTVPHSEFFEGAEYLDSDDEPVRYYRLRASEIE